jgi:hypothetical protein
METQDSGGKGWLKSLPGVLTTIAAVLTAITGLIVALSNLPMFHSGTPARPSAIRPDCIPAYVQRKAYREDYVCVTAETHMRTLQDNELAGSRRAGGGAYGADTCVAGYVWREAFTDDRICVLPETREQAQTDNAAYASRVKR